MSAMANNPKPLTGRRVLAIALAGFGVVLLANSFFIYKALDTFSGLATEHPYARGIDYNRTLAARDAQAALGWQATADAERIAGAGEVALTVRYVDDGGAPLAGLSVSGELRRPVREGLDRRVEFAAVSPGVYRATVPVVEWGQWDLLLIAHDGADNQHRQEQRLWLK